MKEKSHLFYLTTCLSLIQLQGLASLQMYCIFQTYGLTIKASDQKTSVCDSTFLNLITVILFLKIWKRPAIINVMDYSNPVETNQIWKSLYSIIFYVAAYKHTYKKHINFSWIITNQCIAGMMFKWKKRNLVMQVNTAKQSSASAALASHSSQWISQPWQF